jgi:DNA polymerase-3 subunit alpha
VGGLIESKTIKYTKKGEPMAFLSIEDLLGTVEVLVWPGDYDKYSKKLTENAKIFVKGRASVEEEKDAKVICEQIIPFEDVPKKLWIKFANKDEYDAHKGEINDCLKGHGGKDAVVIYIEETKQMKQLPAGMSVTADEELTGSLKKMFGDKNVVIN